EILAWIGLVPGLLLLRAAPTGREAAVRGWWFGAGYLLAALYWLTPNLGPALLLVVIVLGAPWAGVGYGAWRLLRGRAAPADLPSATEPPKASTPTAIPTVATDLLPAPPPPSPTTPGTQATLAPDATVLARAPVTHPAFPRGRKLLRSLAVPGPSTGRALAALLVLPSCWVVIDWLRSWQGIGGPWAVFGASQWQHPVVLALAAVGGIWLVGFVLVAANTGIVVALTATGFPGRLLGAAGALLAVAAGPAAFSLTAAEYSVAPSGHVTLALVQPGLEN